MLLYEVSISYEDVYANQKYDEKLKSIIPTVRSLDDLDALQRPERKMAVYHAAVLEDYGEAPINTAAQQVLKAVIGRPDAYETFKPHVESIKYIGPVAVDRSADELSAPQRMGAKEKS